MRWLDAIPFLALMGTVVPTAQAQESCTVVCGLELKLEPTITVENLADRPRVVTAEGTKRVSREQVFETVLALDLKTKHPRVGFTFEAITTPLADDNDVELEFESNFYWLTETMSRRWLTSHFDIVDQLSPAERPTDVRAYTHKLDFELDTAFHPFARVAEGRWIRGLEVEMSLDYLATGLPRKGDRFTDGRSYLDDASPWSFSLVFVVPIAPF